MNNLNGDRHPVHVFEDSGEAYDVTQCGEYWVATSLEDYRPIPVKTGHILWIPSEGIVAIADTWPIAVTQARGHLHHVANNKAIRENLDYNPAIWPAYREAMLLADRMGYPLVTD